MPATALALKNTEQTKEDSNSFAIKMAGQVRAIQKRRKSRLQRMRNQRR